jgi:hypothetical protein
MLAEVVDAITVIGGSVPPLVLQEPRDDPYAGTLDVDLSLDAQLLNETADEVYATIAEHLTRRGYEQIDPPFRWLRTVTIDGREIDVYLDLLAPPPEEMGRSRRHVRAPGRPPQSKARLRRRPRRVDRAEGAGPGLPRQAEGRVRH